MDRFELRVRWEEGDGPEVSIQGGKKDAVTCLACLINAVERFTGIDRIAMVAAVLAALDTVPLNCESSTVKSGLVEDAYRRLKQRET